MKYAELEVSFHLRDERRYSVEFRYDSPDTQVGTLSEPYLVEFDWEQLNSLVLDVKQYGATLSAMFFADAGIREQFSRALAHVNNESGLRIRLYLRRGTPLLHNLLWETLEDPTSLPLVHRTLATDEHVLLSRFLSSWDFRPVHLQSRDNLRALVAIANPRGIEKQQVAGQRLSSVDAAGEWKRLSTALGRISKQNLSNDGRVSANHITTKLRDGFDIFVLVCHGALIDGEPLLWLENEEGGIARVMGIDLVLRLKDMKDPPRLIVLCSCQSSGAADQLHSNDKGALAALGPRLAEAGIPAVIAMQDNIRMDTASAFLSVFFNELMEDSQIDRAVAVARSSICHDHPDWWVPVLITRLKRGRVWFERQIADVKSFQKWEGLMVDILRCNCTPVIGPDLVTPMFGSPAEIAKRWAEKYDFPMSPQDRDSLPQVAQYLSYHQSRDFMFSELAKHICMFLKRTYPDQLTDIPADFVDCDAGNFNLDNIISHVGAQLRRDNERDVFRMLADLPFPIYINTNRDNLLFDALKEANKNPRKDVCRWTVFEEDQQEWPPSIFVDEPGYKPTVEEPLVFHLFGNLSDPNTLVIAEDDYFNFLIGINKNWRTTFASNLYVGGPPGQYLREHKHETGTEPFPQTIVHALTQGGLLFLGFRTTDWEFRTLFRSLVAQESWTLKKRNRNVSVAVQMEPDENNFLEPQGARKYIEDYFDKKPEVYWGPVDTFVGEILRRWNIANRPNAMKRSLRGG